jgi:hypothetical protein
VRSALALLLAGCAATPTRLEVLPSPEPLNADEVGISWDELNGLGGFVQWQCHHDQPMEFVRTSLNGVRLASVDSLGVVTFAPAFVLFLAHEQTHSEQAASMGCAKWAAMTSDPGTLADLEAEAECEAQAITRKVRCE